MATPGLRRQVGPAKLRARPTTAIVGPMAGQSESRPRRSTLLPVSSGAGLAAALIILIAVSSAFAAVWDRWAGDVDGVRFFQGLLNGATEPMIDAVTALGDRVLRFALGLVVTGWLVYVRRPRLAGMMVAVLLAAGGLVQVLKWTVDRPRPELPPDLDVLATSTSDSFPSGHVAFVALFFGVLAYLAYRDRHAPPWRHGGAAPGPGGAHRACPHGVGYPLGPATSSGAIWWPCWAFRRSYCCAAASALIIPTRTKVADRVILRQAQGERICTPAHGALRFHRESAPIGPLAPLSGAKSLSDP